MRFNYRLFVILLIISTATSCKKDFFNLAPYNSIPLSQALSTEGDLNIASNGMYQGMRNTNLYGRTYPIKGDLMADNVYLKANNSGRYLAFRDYNQTAANTEANDTWNAAYDVIKRANTIISADIPASKNVDELKGQAYAVRALMTFELVRNYAKPYTVDPNALGIPLVTTFDQNALPVRNTVKEVYTQMISDLNQAFTLMSLNIGQSIIIPSTNTTKVLNSSYFTKYAAKALQARVYQHMGDWASAKDAALQVINNGTFSLVESTSYVAYWKNPAASSSRVESMFEVSSDNGGNNGTNSLSNFYELAGYGDAWVTNELYNTYSATDIRRQVILVNTTVTAGNTVYLNNKYSNTTNAADKDDTKVLRYADVILILAEAYANLDDANALIRLNEVAKKRDAAFIGYTSTGAQLKNDIITERRKEFAFEGYRYWDLMRLNLPIPNHTKSQFPTILSPIEITDYHRLFPVPQAELDANPNIRTQQNPGF
ncbi:MAG: RagB/SusD family nutrient uptake outer membrane protein [Chitinophagaceae bacterium]